MKTKLLLLSIIAYIQLYAQASKNIDSTKFSEIKFEEPNHNFGILKKGDDCRFEFKFTNTGNEPLIINSALTSCGCDVASWPKEPILPGESGVIKYLYDSQRIGQFHKTTTVSSNAKNATVILSVKGVVEDLKAPSEILLQIEGN
jgi:hypothetical protein